MTKNVPPDLLIEQHKWAEIRIYISKQHTYTYVYTHTLTYKECIIEFVFARNQTHSALPTELQTLFPTHFLYIYFPKDNLYLPFFALCSMSH